MIKRDIYEVIVVVHETGEIISPVIRVVATSPEAALVKSDFNAICEKATVKPDDVEYAILKLGSLRPVQEVSNGEVSKF